MANTIKNAPDLYTNPPKCAIPGARLDYRVISLLTTDMITTQIIALAVIPPGHRLNYFHMEVDDIDSASSVTIDVGLLNHYYEDPEASVADPGWDDGTTPVLASGYNLITASTVPRTGGHDEPDATVMMSKTIGIHATKSRILAAQFSAAPGTAVAGSLAFVVGVDFP